MHSGLPRHRENREFGFSFFQTAKSRGILQEIFKICFAQRIYLEYRKVLKDGWCSYHFLAFEVNWGTIESWNEVFATGSIAFIIIVLRVLILVSLSVGSGGGIYVLFFKVNKKDRKNVEILIRVWQPCDYSSNLFY